MNKTTKFTFRQMGALKQVFPLLIILLIVGLASCRSDKSFGNKQRVRLTVGEIKDITMPSRGDSAIQLVGTSDNQEVVEVSRQQAAPAVDTLKRDNAGPTIFQLKGITIGTANVIFSERRADEAGNGKARKTYVVQVVSK